MTRAGILAVALLLTSGCNLFGGRPTFKCPKDSAPCGSGCVPTTAVCCDDGTGKTSSYCTNQAGSCYPNDRGCEAAFPSGAAAAYCCGSAGTFGSNDCPEGQRHCGLLCQPADRPCCPDGASSADCPTMSWDPGGCTQAAANTVGCGVCLGSMACAACGAGSCCSGDVCGDFKCVTGPACTGAGNPGPGGGGGCPAACASDSDCADFGARRCTTGPGYCGSDGRCRCCSAQCDVNVSTGQSSNCRCLACSASCTGDRMCLGATCVFKTGGSPCD